MTTLIYGGRIVNEGRTFSGSVVIDNGVNTEDRSDGWLHGLQQTDNRDPLDEWPEENDLLDVAV